MIKDVINLACYYGPQFVHPLGRDGVAGGHRYFSQLRTSHSHHRVRVGIIKTLGLNQKKTSLKKNKVGMVFLKIFIQRPIFPVISFYNVNNTVNKCQKPKYLI